MRYEILMYDGGHQVYDNTTRQVIARFPDLKGEVWTTGDNSEKRATRYMAKLLLEESVP